MWSADESQDPDPFFEAADDAEVPAPAFAPAAPEPGASADPSDVDVSRDDIIARIEALTEGVVRGLLGGQLFALRIPLRNRGNVQLRQEGGYQLGQATKLVECSPSNAAHYVKYWKVLDAIVRLLRSGKKAAQRDLYYMLVDSFRSQTEINEIVQDLAAMLRCSRHALGIVASSRGFVAGRLLWRDDPDSSWVDCSRLGATGRAIPGDLDLIRGAELDVQDARCLVVVEKDGIFQWLSEERFFESVPCILVTGKGYPDLATRALVHRLHSEFGLPVLGLADYNPHGLQLLLTYKLGSARMGHEAFRFVVDLKWVGLRGDDLWDLGLPPECSQPLSDRDRRAARLLLATPFVQSSPAHRDEVERMLEGGRKVELQALHSKGYGFLGNEYLKPRILHGAYI
eukprot:tig00000128_g7222.t1